MQILYKSQDISGFVKTHQPCPHCGHKECSSERADGSTFCFSCGKNTPANTRTSYTPAPQRPIAPAKPIQAVPDCDIHPTMFGVSQSPFITTFRRIMGDSPRGYIGASGDAITFWYRDFAGVVRNGKEMRYQVNGFNRVEEDPKMLYLAKNGFVIPFWGENLLPYFTSAGLTDVFFVESEKSALYAQAMFRRYLWLGCSSATGCVIKKIERCKHLLSDKRLFMLFDNDDAGEEGASQAIANFKRCGLVASTVSVKDIFPDAKDKDDIADAIIRAKGVKL